LKLRRKVVQAPEIKSETDRCDLVCEKDKRCRSVVRESIRACLRRSYTIRFECRRDEVCLILLLLDCNVSNRNNAVLVEAYFCNSTDVLLEGGREASSDPLHISDTFTATCVQAQFQVLEMAGQLQANDVVLGECASLDGARDNVADDESQLQDDRCIHVEDERWNVECDAIVLMNQKQDIWKNLEVYGG
jgi:hypothetical protein